VYTLERFTKKTKAKTTFETSPPTKKEMTQCANYNYTKNRNNTKEKYTVKQNKKKRTTNLCSRKQRVNINKVQKVTHTRTQVHTAPEQKRENTVVRIE